MTALTALRKFIIANRDPENVAEIRAYIEEHVVELAHDLGVSEGSIIETLEGEQDDALLAQRMLKLVSTVLASQRANKKEGRSKAAQAAADALGASATWDGQRVQLDLPAILTSALTKRQDLLVFTTDTFDVAVLQEPLIDLARLRRRDLSGFVDAEGLHVRWRTGGLNLRPQVDPHAGRIVVSLSRGAVAA